MFVRKCISSNLSGVRTKKRINRVRFQSKAHSKNNNEIMIYFFLLLNVKVQANSIIMNYTGPSEFVRFNFDICITVKTWVGIHKTS